MTRCIDCGGEIIEGEDHRCHTQLPIIILVDEITHTPEWPQCKDPTCPCQDEVEDQLDDVPPTEAELDAQEAQSGGARSIDWSKIFDDGALSREADQARNVTHQCSDGSWW